MKKVFLFALVSFIALASFSQSDKFVQAMEPKVAAFDSTRSNEGLQELANSFERIAEAEKTQWLPYYYAALCNANLANNWAMAAGQMGGNADKVDPLTDKAEQLLSKAEALSKDNSEIFVVKKMIASARMMGDVMGRYQTQMPLASAALETARKLNPENPRTYILEGIDKFYTPEQFGGSKEEAKKLFETAKAKFETFKPESPIYPNWGQGILEYFLAQVK